MSEFVTLAMAGTGLLFLHYYAVGHWIGLLTVDGIFTVASWTMLVGTIALLPGNQPLSYPYAAVVFVPFFVYVLASISLYVVVWAKGESKERPGFGHVVTYRPGPWFYALLSISAGASVAYYVAVGYNLLLLSILGSAPADAAAFSELRLDSYSGERYLFPGYVNQFKNVLLPALSVVACTYMLRRRMPAAVAVVPALAVLTVLSLLGTGQRGAFTLFAGTFATYLWLLSPTVRRRRFSYLALTALPNNNHRLTKPFTSVEDVAKRTRLEGYWPGTIGEAVGGDDRHTPDSTCEVSCGLESEYDTWPAASLESRAGGEFSCA